MDKYSVDEIKQKRYTYIDDEYWQNYERIKAHEAKIKMLQDELETLKCLCSDYVIDKRRKYVKDLMSDMKQVCPWLSHNPYRTDPEDRMYDKIQYKKQMLIMIDKVKSFDSKYSITDDELDRNDDFHTEKELSSIRSNFKDIDDEKYCLDEFGFAMKISRW